MLTPQITFKECDALHACKNECDETDPIELLLKNNANVYETNNQGKTALMIAKEYGCEQIAKFLKKMCKAE